MPRTTAKPETPTRRSTDTSEQDELTPLFHVVLLNDEEHSYEYVVEMLGHYLLRVSASAAFQHAVEVDTTGRTIVMTCEREQAEFGRDQIHAAMEPIRACRGLKAPCPPSSNRQGSRAKSLAEVFSSSGRPNSSRRAW